MLALRAYLLYVKVKFPNLTFSVRTDMLSNKEMITKGFAGRLKRDKLRCVDSM